MMGFRPTPLLIAEHKVPGNKRQHAPNVLQKGMDKARHSNIPYVPPFGSRIGIPPFFLVKVLIGNIDNLSYFAIHMRIVFVL